MQRVPRDGIGDGKCHACSAITAAPPAAPGDAIDHADAWCLGFAFARAGGTPTLCWAHKETVRIFDEGLRAAGFVERPS